MDSARLAEILKTQRLGRVMHLMQVTTSTRDEAFAAIESGVLRPGAMIVADRQTKGRGTPGKAFLSDEPTGVWVTMCLGRPVPEPVTLLAGAALAVCLRERFEIDAHVKWPNDVLVGRRKIAGIIAEQGRVRGGEEVCLLSAGVNVSREGFEGTPLEGIATSMRMEGSAATREDVLAAFLESMERALERGDAAGAFRATTRMLGKRVRVLEDGAGRNVEVLDVDSGGALVVRNDRGATERWVSSANRDIGTDYA